MISIQNKFLFIHVPKTGGNSIQNILKNYSEDKIVILGNHQDGIERFEIINTKYNIKKHSTISCYKDKIEKNIYEKLFKFSTIRNPWDMCVSFYFSPHRGIIKWNKDDFREFILSIPPISYYISLNPSLDISNYSFNFNELNEKKPLDYYIDFLMRFENLDQDFMKVCEFINIPYEKLPIRNKSNRNHYSLYYDMDLKNLVEKKFEEEIEYGKYIFGK